MEERILGSSHMETIDTLNSLGAVLHRQGRFTEAEQDGLQVLEGSKRILG